MTPSVPSPADDQHALVSVALAADAAGRYGLPVSVAEMLRAGASPTRVLEVTMLALVDRVAVTAELPRIRQGEGVVL